ncbi:MAG: isoprenylcysteine carboxylmethyltransferase family protein [Myxococcota bacterium]
MSGSSGGGPASAPSSGPRAGLLLKNLLFTVLVPGSVAVYVPLLLAPERTSGSWPFSLLGGGLLAVGGAIYAWCVYDFASFGRGTPAPIDAPQRLVERGLYRVSRNPMYLGVLTVILGWAAWYRAPSLVLYALGVGLVFHAFVVLYEEPRLAELFGASYDAYRTRVGRWLRVGGGRAKPR